jgi:hypothetical protein
MRAFKIQNQKAVVDAVDKPKKLWKCPLKLLPWLGLRESKKGRT